MSDFTIHDRVRQTLKRQAPRPMAEEEAAIAAFLAQGGQVEVCAPDPEIKTREQFRQPAAQGGRGGAL